MASPETQVCNTRRLARIFTPSTPRHHPLLDPSIPQEDVPLVPKDLSPRGSLKWELPNKARTNLHIMLKLSNKADELLDEFHEKIPLIDDILSEWAEMRGASPTIEGLEKLRAQSSRCSGAWEDEIQGYRNDGYVFNMVRNLETPSRADVIYLTDAVKDDDMQADTARDILPNIRGHNWFDFDGSYIQVQDIDDSVDQSCAVPEPLRVSKEERRDSIPSNLRTADWGTDQEVYLAPNAYNARADSDADEFSRQVGPYEGFWRHHEVPDGPRVALRDDKNEPISHCSPRRTLSDLEISSLSKSSRNQDPAHLMVPTQQPKQSP